MRGYFVRFVINEYHAQNDLERGYSFNDYTFFSTPEEVAEYYGLETSDYEIADYGDNMGYYIARGVENVIAPVDPEFTLWGLAINGLAGFGAFESVEEAREYAIKHRGYNGVEYPLAAIFYGREIADPRCWEGTTFAPSKIIEFVKLED